MALVARAMESFGVGDKLQRVANDLDHRCGQTTAELLEQLIVLRLLGGEALTDTEALGDQALLAMFGWDQTAHPTTYARRLKGFSMGHSLGLQTLIGDLSRVLDDGRKTMLVAIDSTVTEAYGQQQGAELGYHPRKPGRPSYHPILAVHVGDRSIMDGYLRPGSSSSNNGLEQFIRKIMAETQGDPDRVIFRLDKGMTSGEVLDAIEEIKAGYVAKVIRTTPLMARINALEKWRDIGGGAQAASFQHQPDSWGKPRRLVVIKRPLEPKDDPQGHLFDPPGFRCEIMVTNQKLNSENVWRLYNQGAVVEQVIEEVKNDLAAASIKTDCFQANDALFLTGLIAYNLLNCLRRQALPASFRTARLKRIALVFFNLGANLVRHGRQLWIKLSAAYPWRRAFYKALAALSPA